MKHNLFRIAIVVALSMQTFHGISQEERTLTQILNQIDKLIVDFETTKESYLLNEALLLISAIDTSEGIHSVDGMNLTYKAKKDFYVKFLNAVEEEIIIGFNFNDKPQLHVCPPDPNIGDVAYMCGMDPDAIQNNTARELYIKAIEENKIKSGNYIFQSNLNILKDRALRQFSAFAIGFISGEEEWQKFMDFLNSNLKYPNRVNDFKKRLRNKVFGG